MYIIQALSYDDGSRPPLQKWDEGIIPEGYLACPDEFYDVFYSTNPAGFVTITERDGVVVAMEINQAALDEYVNSIPVPEPKNEPTTGELMDILLGVTD